MKELTEGCVVHYVLPVGQHLGEHRGAIVTRVWDKVNGYVNLMVFQDGTNDGVEFGPTPTWVTSVNYSEAKELRTWHWIEKNEEGSL